MKKDIFNSGNLTIKLLRSIGTPFHKPVEVVESEKLYELAFKNKIPLLYLEKLKENGKLNKLKDKYKEHLKKYRNFVEVAGEIAKEFKKENIEYVFFKTFKPFLGTGSDIDLLIFGDVKMYRKAIETLLRIKYRPEMPIVDVKKLNTDEEYKDAAKILSIPTSTILDNAYISPGGTDLRDPTYNILIDLQYDISVGYAIYIDKNNLKGNVIETELIDGSKICVLKPEYDLAVEMAHSLTENMFLLSEFYVFLFTISKMNEKEISNFLEVIKKNNLITPAKVWITLTSLLCDYTYNFVPEKLIYLQNKIGTLNNESRSLLKKDLKMPHRYKLSTELSFVMGKLRERIFRDTFIREIFEMIKNPKHTLMVVFDMYDLRTRETYIHDVTVSTKYNSMFFKSKK
ncbi:MAG: hypothetical protein ACK4YO_01680 [Candidatus Altarchaeaceae archaeon]